MYRWQIPLWLYFGNTLTASTGVAAIVCFGTWRPARPPKADWLELLIQIAPRQATRGLRQSGQRQRRRPFLAQQEVGAFYSTRQISAPATPHNAISSAVCRRYHRSRPHHCGEPYISGPSIRQGSKAVFVMTDTSPKLGLPYCSGMANIPAANTLATTIKAIISTPPWGPLVFLIGVAFPIIALLVIFWQLF